MNLENRNFLAIIAIVVGLFGTIIFTYAKLDTKIDNLTTMFHQETKDFHARLCVLESRYLDILENKK